MVGVGGVVCRKWSGYWGGLEKVVGVVGVNCIRGGADFCESKITESRDRE